MTVRMYFKRAKYFFLYLLVKLLIAFSTLVPRSLWLWFCGWLGECAYYLMPKFRQDTLRHLSLAFKHEKSFSDLIRLGRQAYRMLGKNAGDIIRALPIKTVEQLDEFMVTEGLHHFYAAQAKGKGVLLLTCHLGAFELQAVNAVLRKIKLISVGTPLKDPRLNRLLYSYRNSHEYGSTVERGKDMLKLIRTLKKGGVVAMLIDQDTRTKSRFVDFFGMPASTPVGLTLLALKTGAAVLPSYIYLGEDQKQHHCILPEIPLRISGDEEKDLVDNTQVFTRFIEAQIRKHPTQWIWMHERWKTKPGQEIR